MSIDINSVETSFYLDKSKISYSNQDEIFYRKNDVNILMFNFLRPI